VKGERPRQPHYAAVWDASQAVGRTEVTDLIEDVLTRLRTEERMFPDLHAHKVTAALIKAGYLDAVVVPHIDDIIAAAERKPARDDAEDLLAQALDGPAGEDDYSVEPLRRIIAALS